MKKIICVYILMSIIGTLCTGCGTNETTESNVQSSNAITIEEEKNTDTEKNEVISEESIEKEIAAEEDFKIANLEDGTVSIVGYLGASAQVVIPETIAGKSVTVIDNAFNGNEVIESVVIPNTVIEIGNATFLSCRNLSNVTLGTGLQSIGQNAFMGCVKLEEIALPEGLKEIGKGAFNDCSLKQISLPTSLEGRLEGLFLMAMFDTVTIPSGIEEIGYETFYYCTELKEVVIQSGVEKIGEKAFEECEKLEKVVIPASVTEIDDRAFRNSKNVTIVGEAGSYAESYATKNEIPFEIQ